MSHRAGPLDSGSGSRRLNRRNGLRLFLFNGFELRQSNGLLQLPLSAERLVAFLALHDSPQCRAYVAGTLWPDTSDSRAAANLRSSLWRIRQTNRPVVEATGTRLRLCGNVAVDVRELAMIMRKLFERLSELQAADIARLLAPAELLRGWYEDWVTFERERLRQLHLHALEYLCELLVEQRRFAMAVDAAMTAVSEEPLRESARRSLIRAYLAEGNLSEAIREYRGYRQLLNDELGVNPSGEMEGLVEQLSVR